MLKPKRARPVRAARAAGRLSLALSVLAAAGVSVGVEGAAAAQPTKYAHLARITLKNLYGDFDFKSETFFSHGTSAELTPQALMVNFDCRGDYGYGSVDAAYDVPFRTASLQRTYAPGITAQTATTCEGDSNMTDSDHAEPPNSPDYAAPAKVQARLDKDASRAKRYAHMTGVSSGPAISAKVFPERQTAVVTFADAGPGSLESIRIRRNKTSVLYYPHT